MAALQSRDRQETDSRYVCGGAGGRSGGRGRQRIRRRLLSPARVRQPGVTGSGGSRDVNAAKQCGGQRTSLGSGCQTAVAAVG